MTWRASAPTGFPAIEFSPSGPDQTCLLRLRRPAPLRDDSDSGQGQPKPPTSILADLGAIASERLTQHPAAVKAANVAAERAQLGRQQAEALGRLEELRRLRKSVLAQARARWRERSEELTVRIADMEKQVAGLDANLAICCEAETLTATARDGAVDAVVAEAVQDRVAELDGERSRLTAELEAVMSPLLDQLASLHAKRRDFANPGVKRALAVAALKVVQAEADERRRSYCSALAELAKEENAETETIPANAG